MKAKHKSLWIGASRWRRLACLSLGFLLTGADTAVAEDAGAPRVIQFTPQGTVKGVRQATARFSEPMVPLGDPRAAKAPFEIDCPERAKGRWVDSRNWAYDFERDLPGGIRCTFRLRSGLASLGGKPILGQPEFRFSTGGPAIVRSIPFEGAPWIDEEQAFVIALDAEATNSSVVEKVWFQVEGLADRVGVRVVEGGLRDDILKTIAPWFPGEPRVVLRARQRFPNEARVRLVWGAGVSSKTGVATTQEQTLAFKTRKAFTATFSCTRENRRAGCNPVTGMLVEFSAPVLKSKALEIALIGADGKRWAAADKDEGELQEWSFVNSVEFPGPFPEETSFRIEIPADLKDQDGRALANAERFPLTARTGTYPPLAKFSSRFGIIEWKTDPALPITLRNLEPKVRMRLLQVERQPREGLQGRVADLLEKAVGKVLRIPPGRGEEILPWLRRVAVARREESVFGSGTDDEHPRSFSLPKPNGEKAFEVVGIPLESPGLYVVEIESPRLGASLLGAPRPMFVPTAALVTNLAVHLKRGHESSLVWVTTLDEGKPAARVRKGYPRRRFEAVENDGYALPRPQHLRGRAVPTASGPEAFRRRAGRWRLLRLVAPSTSTKTT
jgi:hypothetical protein